MNPRYLNHLHLTSSNRWKYTTSVWSDAGVFFTGMTAYFYN